MYLFLFYVIEKIAQTRIKLTRINPLINFIDFLGKFFVEEISQYLSSTKLVEQNVLKCFDFSYLGERLIVILLRLLLSIEFLESTMLDRLIFRNIAIPLFLIAFVPVKCLLAFWVTLIQSKSLLNKTLLFSVFEETILELLPSYFLSFDVDDVTASFFAEDFDRSLFLLLLPDKRLIPRMLNLIFKHSDCGVGISGA